ncbi:hypothetical protein SLEP1_g39965 [Rubroshorea leprosula]|uniref:Uncharacterized protein n=1 Tax=Rubroshorea leprosula TaxID=152421 RepID=A0AAV5L2Q6_9ROSI|nr:hypothetical protein SLEP1_g39965 [Rubroshorea leprosula]
MSKQLFLKYLDFLRPLYQRIRGCKPGDKSKGVDARVQPRDSALLLLPCSRTKSPSHRQHPLLGNENFRSTLFLPLLLAMCGCEFFKFLIPLISPSIPSASPKLASSGLLAEFSGS